MVDKDGRSEKSDYQKLIVVIGICVVAVVVAAFATGHNLGNMFEAFYNPYRLIVFIIIALVAYYFVNEERKRQIKEKGEYKNPGIIKMNKIMWKNKYLRVYVYIILSIVVILLIALIGLSIGNHFNLLPTWFSK
jgi:Na+/melibiose symporter-like transporter